MAQIKETGVAGCFVLSCRVDLRDGVSNEDVDPWAQPRPFPMTSDLQDTSCQLKLISA